MKYKPGDIILLYFDNVMHTGIITNTTTQSAYHIKLLNKRYIKPVEISSHHINKYAIPTTRLLLLLYIDTL